MNDETNPAFPPVEFLVVEDDEISVMAIRRAMKKLGLDNPLKVAGDGVEALALLQASVDGGRPLPPCIVALDLNMPRMGGLEFLGHVRADPRLAKLVVFVLTTSDDPDDIAAAYAQNIAGYLVKENLTESFRKALVLLHEYSTQVVLPR